MVNPFCLTVILRLHTFLFFLPKKKLNVYWDRLLWKLVFHLYFITRFICRTFPKQMRYQQKNCAIRFFYDFLWPPHLLFFQGMRSVYRTQKVVSNIREDSIWDRRNQTFIFVYFACFIFFYWIIIIILYRVDFEFLYLQRFCTLSLLKFLLFLFLTFLQLRIYYLLNYCIKTYVFIK